MDHALVMRTPLQEFQDAIAANPTEDKYLQKMNELVLGRCKEVMQEAMNWITDETEETERGEVTFTFADVKGFITELATKTRMLIYLCASRVSLQSGPENAVTTALMVAAWCVVLSCIHTNPGT